MPRTSPRSGRATVGHFVDEDRYAHFLSAYRAGMSVLPSYTTHFDVPTTFGSVRVYRFDGPRDATPVVLLPGRNAATPMWRANLPGVLQQRTAFCVDLLGEAGLSVQNSPLAGAGDQALWFDQTLAGLGLGRAHLMGASIGGWTAVNAAARHPGRVASLTLLDPVMTFARIPLRTMLIAAAIGGPGVPGGLRRRAMTWIGGGAPAPTSGGGGAPAPTSGGDGAPEAELIAAAALDFVLHQPAPKRITDEQLRGLDVPVLALLAGRSVMLDAKRAAEKARDLLPQGQVEVWADASHAINGEFPERIARRTHRFWDAC